MEKLGQRLLELLNSGIDLLTAELPLFVGELITYKTVEMGFYTLGGLALLVFAGYKANKAIKESKKPEKLDRWYYTRLSDKEQKKYDKWAKSVTSWYSEGILATHIIFGALSCIIGLVAFLSNIGDFIKIAFAPRVWLLEFATNLIK